MNVHLVGIGGTGVSALADVFLRRGDRVSGSDLRESATTRRLAAAGAEIFIGHDPAHIAGKDLVVYSPAAEGSAEVAAARRAGLPLRSKPEMFAQLIAESPHSVGVTGSAGKTTVTLMTGQVLVGAGLDPTVLVGDGTSARAGDGDWLVAECDESQDFLLVHRPQNAIVTNIHFDHPDHYGSLEEVKEVIAGFLAQLPASGTAVLGADDPLLMSLQTPARRLSYGFAPTADYRCGEGRPFELFRAGQRLGKVGLAVPGRHNVLNATAAAAMALELGVDFDTVATALAGYRGASRRLERLGSWRGAEIYDDYAHHPEKVRATLAAARELGNGRLIVVFQPHRYSRFGAFMDDFAAALVAADGIVVTEVYAAGEPNPDGLTAARLAERIPGALFAPDLDAARELLQEVAREGDVMVFMGAGDIGTLARELVGAV
jgi:UDP-N-acetylmuramate--alanine ligase